MEILKEEKPFVLLIVGSPNSGKSHQIRYITYCLAKKKRINRCVVISASSDISGDFDWQDEDYLFDTYSDKLLENIIEIQKNNLKPGLLILDDCIGEANFGSKVFKRLISTYRHLKLSIIISVQYLNSVLPPLFRNCCSFASWFRQDTAVSLKALYDSFGQRGFSKLDEFKAYTIDLKKYQFIWYSKECESNEQCYKKMICPAKIPEFKLDFSAIKRRRVV
jgi:hypothetical protein